MRRFSKKLAFALAAAMVLVTAAPAAQAKAADDFTLNRTAATLYVNKGVNDAGKVEGLAGNVQEYNFNLKNKPADWQDYGYKWSSDNEKVATVVAGGVTTAVGVGKATISCVVTDKATGNVVDTLKATVTVKANAKEVLISNAAAVDGKVVTLDDPMVDLNRTMVDEKGYKTSTRGKYVTDLTKWVAEPAAGVEINQTNGQFTFTEDAVAGEYKLYCYTYQSDKYAAQTAKSEAVVVEFVKESAFEVKQDTAKKFTVKFDAPVKALTTADVTVTRLLELGADNVYEYPVVVKSATLAKDGMSAAVEMFADLGDANKYVVNVKGYEATEFTSSFGKPVSMTIVAKDANPAYVLTTGKAAELKCNFFDANGVDVTTGKENVVFRLETRSTDGSYYLAGKNLTIKKEMVVTVIADFQGWIENGKRVGQFDESQEFAAVNAPTAAFAGVIDKTVNGKWGGDASLVMRKSAKPTLSVEILKTNGITDEKFKPACGVAFADGTAKVTYTAITPDVAVISTTGVITAFKTGVASFYVNLSTLSNGKWSDATPIAVINVVVEDDAAFSYIAMDGNAAITIGTKAPFNTGDVVVAAFDTYNQKWTMAADDVTVKCVSDGFAEGAFASAITKSVADGKVKITVDAIKAKAALGDLAPKAGEVAVVYFTANYKNQSAEFSVMIQEPSGEGNYVQIEADKDTVDALVVNENNKKAAQTVTFKVFEMNNGVKVDELLFGAYPADGKGTSVDSNAYVYKVTKDGQDFKGAVAVSGNAVTVTLSGTKAVSNSALQASVVSYDNAGAGTYEFALYKCYGEGDDRVLVQELSSVVSVSVGDAGAYVEAGDLVSNSVKLTGNYEADAAELLKCFTINDRKGNNVLKKDATPLYAKYFVNYEAPANTGYVKVTDITFYEEVSTGVYVPYVVTLNQILEVK